MKKLMIAAAIVCAAALSQASTANWRFTNDKEEGLMYTCGSGGKSTQSGMVYFFHAGQQSDVFDQWLADGTMLTSASIGAGKTLTDGWMGAAPSLAEYTTDESGTGKIYFFTALIDDSGNLFISSTKGGSISAAAAGTQVLMDYYTASRKAAIEGATAYSSAGWYAAAAVPEPTSGLLLLLGVAGLALKRKRA